MKLANRFEDGGTGVMATAGSDGTVNTAVYAVPHVIDDKTVAWGMTEGRTYRFTKENPHAAYLYFSPRGDGVRLTLALKSIETSGELLEKIRARAVDAVGSKAGSTVKYLACFHVLETRPLA